MTEEDNPLDNVAAQLEQTQQAQQKKDAEDAKDKKDNTDAAEAEEAEDLEHGPPFPFKDSKQGPLYPHKDRWDELDDAKFGIEQILREHGVRNIHGREFDDAILKHAIQHPDAVAELVLEARDIEITETDSDTS